MEAPAILVTGEQRRSAEIEKVEKGSPKSEEGRRDNCEKGKARSSHGEGLSVRLGREGRRKSETPQFRIKNEEHDAGESGEKAKEGQNRKREEKTRSGGKRGEERLPMQTKEEEAVGRSRKRGTSPNQPPSSSLLLGADLGVLIGRQGRRKSEVRLYKNLVVSPVIHLVNIFDHIERFHYIYASKPRSIFKPILGQY